MIREIISRENKVEIKSLKSTEDYFSVQPKGYLTILWGRSAVRRKAIKSVKRIPDLEQMREVRNCESFPFRRSQRMKAAAKTCMEGSSHRKVVLIGMQGSEPHEVIPMVIQIVCMVICQEWLTTASCARTYDLGSQMRLI